MTCVVGYIDGEVVLLASDCASVDSNGYIVLREQNSKVWRVSIGSGDEIIVGFCGDFGIGTIIKHLFQWPKKKHEPFPEYFSKVLLQLETFLKKRDKKEDDWSLLIGAAGQLYTIIPGGVVETSVECFSAIGSSELIAKGAMHIMQSTRPSWEILEEALLAAAHFDSSVRAPFTMEYLMK